MASPPENAPKKTMADLLAVMAQLRTPETGCPWDLVQTFETIAPYTIEEAYEVADAIARSDLPDLKDELGDLLFQAVYHSRIAEEAGAFDFSDVVHAITSKMLRRHPHVFGTAEERAAGATPGFWERIKSEERALKAAERSTFLVADGTKPVEAAASAEPKTLAGVPAGLPALTRAIKLQDKAARVGFDWPGLEPVLAKAREEIAELDEAIGGRNREQIEEEFGDLLFVMANLARHLRVDPEAALRAANGKFVRRFHYIERELEKQGRLPAQSDLDEMDRLWNEAKTLEKATRKTI